MARPSARKPLPALIFLVALSLLSALVWWRVLHRTSTSVAKPKVSASCVTPSAVVVSVVPAPGTVLVKVLNSTNRTGLAATVAATLTHLGFQINGPVANDPNPIAGVADVRYGPAGTAAATLLSYYIPGATLVADKRTDASVDLSLGAQFTTVAAPTDVAKALASAHIAQATAPVATPTVTPSGSVHPGTSTSSTPAATRSSC